MTSSPSRPSDMASSPERPSRGASEVDVSEGISSGEALAFLDPVLAEVSRGVDLVRVLLDGQQETDPIVLTGAEESAVASRLIYHRLHPQLAEAVGDGRIVLSDEMRASVEESVLGLAVRSLGLERFAVELAAILSSAGVEFLVLKGMATRYLDYADPLLRQTSDVDILVRPQRFETALAALAGSGFVRRKALDLLDKGEAWESPAGVVDVHTRPHAAGRFLGGHWWETSEVFLVAGHELRALARGGRLAHAASHYSVAYPNHRFLSSLLDLLVISRSSDDGDRAEAERFLREVGVSDITARITSRAAVLAGEPGVSLGREGHRPLDVMLRRAYDRSDLDLAMIKLAKTFGMPWNEKGRAIRGLLFPTEEFLAEGGYRSRTDRLVALVQRRRLRARADRLKDGDG